MKFKSIFLIVAFAMLMLAGLPAGAQTPDGETPANEGVCDELIGGTPGLYGLCVGFCEAQDCVTDFDAATGEVTFSEDCKPSSPKLLENYNKRMQPGDPPMPCINVTENQCPCWLEGTLAQIADGPLGAMCADGWVENQFETILQGFDGETGLFEMAKTTADDELGNYLCFLQRGGVLWFHSITPEEREWCRASIIAECESRNL